MGAFFNVGLDWIEGIYGYFALVLLHQVRCFNLTHSLPFQLKSCVFDSPVLAVPPATDVLYLPNDRRELYQKPKSTERRAFATDDDKTKHPSVIYLCLGC